MVIDCMLSAGLTEFQVELGNVAFLMVFYIKLALQEILQKNY